MALGAIISPQSWGAAERCGGKRHILALVFVLLEFKSRDLIHLNRGQP